jgi:hypothetical protein
MLAKQSASELRERIRGRIVERAEYPLAVVNREREDERPEFERVLENPRVGSSTRPASSRTSSFGTLRPASCIATSVHTFAAEWRTGLRRNEADLTGPACVLRFPSPLRRRYAAAPAFGFVIGVDGPGRERAPPHDARGGRVSAGPAGNAPILGPLRQALRLSDLDECAALGSRRDRGIPARDAGGWAGSARRSVTRA